MEWQPIETAPKDGTPIHIAVFVGDPWGWVIGWGYWVDVAGIDGWISHGYHDPPGNLSLGRPDLWQSLPDFPDAVLPPPPEDS